MVLMTDDPDGGDSLTWHALPPSARPIPICYGIDWTCNYMSPENSRRLCLRHPLDGNALPWLAHYPNGGIHLFHPVVNPTVHKREVADLVDHFCTHTWKHKISSRLY